MYKFFEGIDQVSHPQRYVRIRSEPVLVNPCRTWHCYAETEHRRQQLSVDSLKSLYGYTWTVLHPSIFADQIIGIEYKVVDLRTNEALAVARDYYMLPKYVSDKGSSAGGSCKKPNGLYAPNRVGQIYYWRSSSIFHWTKEAGVRKSVTRNAEIGDRTSRWRKHSLPSARTPTR